MSPARVTIRSMWDALLAAPAWDELLTWPPDVFLLVERVLDASEAYRFAVSPPEGRVRSTETGGGTPVAVAKEWCEWLDGTRASLPPLLEQWWKVLLDARDLKLRDLSAGADWPVCEALLALHAAADEACAGLGCSITAAPGPGRHFRAAAREVLAESGSLSRVSPDVLLVLPKARTSTSGMSIRSLARHVCVRGPQVDVGWHRVLSRPSATGVTGARANVLMLPWPLRVRSTDFKAVHRDLPYMDPGKTGFFEFCPADGLDLDLVDGVLHAAEDESGAVDMVVLPEGAILAEEIEPLEAVLAAHGVWGLVAGVRGVHHEGSTLGRNWVHIGIRQEFVWRHVVQHKHHRWSLDANQVNQYHLGAALNPSMRWWEAIEIPHRSLEIIDVGAGVTLAPLVCEDLARMEPVTDLIRSIGPSLVITLLLDGPQLASRWTARYASVLADDPGCAVCTLTSYGMVRRSRPAGYPPSNVVALWKDPSGGLVEIALENGSHGVLLTANVTFGDSFTADGRTHPGSNTDFTLVAVQSLRADAGARRRTDHAAPAPVDKRFHALDERELSKATSWCETVAEAAVTGDGAVRATLADAVATDWRDELQLPRPSALFREAVDVVRPELTDEETPATIAQLARDLAASDDGAAMLTGTLLGLALDQRVATELRQRRLTVADLGRFGIPSPG